MNLKYLSLSVTSNSITWKQNCLTQTKLSKKKDPLQMVSSQKCSYLQLMANLLKKSINKSQLDQSQILNLNK